MSAPPDPDEITAPRDPAEYRPKPLMGVGFWALIALCVLCVLAGALEKHGVEARRLVLYETGPVQLSDAQAQTLIRADAALIHSPRAAQVLAKVLKAHPAPQLRAFGLSKAVMKPLQRTPLASKAYPPFPLEAALLNLIDRNP